jgi:hypothetical protein
VNLLRKTIRVSLPLLALTIVDAAFIWPTRAADAPSDPAFEKPAEVRHVRLGPAGTKPISYKEIRCSYFPGIMIKEWDEREIGDKQISYVMASGPTKPACQKAALPDEHVLSTRDLTVYLLGHAGGAIFLRDADGANDTIGFYVFDPQTGRQRFTDTIKLDSKFSTIAADGDTLRLGYIRALVGPCSVVIDRADCWNKIAAAAELAGEAPDCTAGYRTASQRFAEDVCTNQRGDKKPCLAEQTSRRADWDKAPSVIAFAANAVLGPSSNMISSASGPLQCWPSD